MTPRSMKDAVANGTYYRFNIAGWTCGLEFPAADSIEEGLSYVRDFERDEKTTLRIVSVERHLPQSRLGCAWLETVIKPVPHTQDSDCLADPETGCCVVCGVGVFGDPCPACNGHRYHADGCPEIEQETV